MVSILVVLDDALVQLYGKYFETNSEKCLNPCCAGRCSSTGNYAKIGSSGDYAVSILVVLDDALVLLVRI